MNIEKLPEKRQEIRISDRSRLTLTGVENVESFDDTSIILNSNFGMIAIDGECLHISLLSVDEGELIIEGKIGGVVFFEPPTEKHGKKKRGLSASREKKADSKDSRRGFFG